YRSSFFVTTSTLNVPRAEMIIHGILDECEEPSGLIPNKETIKNHVPTPRNVSLREAFIRRYCSPFKIPLIVEPALHNYTTMNYENDLYLALKHKGFLHPEEYFILHAPNNNDFKKPQVSGSKRSHLSIWFSQNAKSEDIIKGFYHACAIRRALERLDVTALNKDRVLDIIKRTHEWVDSTFDTFINALAE
ncbi:616_t:CDS:1, partial [Acaulospora morrowiae]